MPKHLIPLTILGGSDRRASRLPPSGRDQQPLTGCKGVDLRIDGRPLAAIIAERFAQTGMFGPIYVAGPSSAYRGVANIEAVFDTDSGFGGNIQAGISGMRERHPSGVLSMTTCDILPKVAEVKLAVEEYWHHAPSDLWFPMISAPEDDEALGSSAWKPRYRIPDPRGDSTRSIPVLPSHLAIFDPEAMRLRFLFRLLDIAYRTRNRPVLYRRSYFVRQMLFSIIYRDLMNLFSLRLPTLSWDTLAHAPKAALKLSEGRLTRPDLEYALRRIFVQRKHRKTHPDRKTRMPILEGLSLARDIDTLEEAIALGVVRTSLLESEE